MLAHELRNPLAPVSAAAELLASGRLNAAASQKASQVISRQVRHMTELVDDLLDISRVSRGEITLSMLSLDMKTVVNSAIEQVRPLIESRDHTLSITLAPATVNVTGDEKRLIQAIANLLSNAAKYTEPGGAIGIHLSGKDDQVCVEISDNGMGIDPALQTSIFEMFEQVQRTSDRTTGGLGIGLALVRSIINLHGGTVACRSGGIGQGSWFTACIPRLLQAGTAPGKPSRTALPEMAPPSAQLSILVVDDNVDAAEMLEFFLTTAGHRLRIAHSAHAALEAVREASPDVCILDLGLPDSTGHALAVTIRQLAAPPPVLIALTGYSTARDRDQAAEAGFDFYFVKPADLGELSRALASVTARAS